MVFNIYLGPHLICVFLAKKKRKNSTSKKKKSMLRTELDIVSTINDKVCRIIQVVVLNNVSLFTIIYLQNALFPTEIEKFKKEAKKMTNKKEQQNTTNK